MKGRILIINPGSTSTKIGFYEDGQQKFETNLTHSAEEIAKYESVMHQGDMRRDAIVNFLTENGVELEEHEHVAIASTLYAEFGDTDNLTDEEVAEFIEQYRRENPDLGVEA